MTLSTSRVLSTDSKSGFRTPAAPTRASTAVPSRAGFGTVATGWHPTTATTIAAIAAMRGRLPEITGSQRGEDDRAHQEGNDEDPGGPVDLALQAATRAIPAAGPVPASADRSAEARRLRCLDQDARHQKDREDGLRDDERRDDLSHGTSRFYLAPHRGEAGVDGRPVEGVEPGRDVIRPLVLVLQVVSVLPDVDSEDRGQPFHVRAVLVRIRLDEQLAVLVDDQPRPAASELADRRLLQLLFERVIAAKRGLDGVRDAPLGSPAAARTHDGPEDRVVRVAAGVVANHVPDVLGHFVDTPEQVFDRLYRQTGMSLERRVGVVHVGRVVLVVMDLHRPGVDVRLESIEPVGKRRNYKCHCGTLPWSEIVLLPTNQSKRYPISNLEHGSPAPGPPPRAARFPWGRRGSATTRV